MIRVCKPCGGVCRGASEGEWTPEQCRLCWRILNPGRSTKVVRVVPQPRGVVGCCGPKKVLTIMGGPVTWACGITTVPERGELLHRTLGSLAVGGFPEPQVFVERGLRAFGTWWTGLVELWVRNPHADRFAMFQDDVVCCKNARRYLDQVPHPEAGYWNLYTTRDNEEVVKAAGDGTGWYESAIRKTTPHDPKCQEQVGRGALALVFPRQALVELLTSRHLVTRPMDRPPGAPLDGKDMADRSIDGCVVTAMNKAGYREYVHVPSLVQHLDGRSTIGVDLEEQFEKLGKKRPPRVAKSFPGESFDAVAWLK